MKQHSSTAEIRRLYHSIEAGQTTQATVQVSGRLMLRRVQGKLAFGTLQDATGRIQLFAPAKTTPDFEKFSGCSIGDWLEVEGEVMKTKRGELSVRVDGWKILARTQHPFPDKWHGLADMDTRYRQRYLDMWVTEEVAEVFAIRSRILSATRHWLEGEGYIEVETPILHSVPGGALAKPFVTHHDALGMDLYLRVAPELYLKRLVVGGMEKVFEIGRVFRNEGLSTRHNPEFTLLELYAAHCDYTDMMELTQKLILHLAGEVKQAQNEAPAAATSGGAPPATISGATAPATKISGDRKLDFGDRQITLASAPWRRVKMTELVEEATGQSLNLETPRKELEKTARSFDITTEDWWGTGKLLCEIYEKACEPNLWEPTFVMDYPLEVSPLALSCPDQPGFTERFELIVGGREIANAFSELTDPKEQRQRFEAQSSQRQHGDEEAMLVDEDYVRALEYGLPPTGGLGVGIDRLVSLLAGKPTIRDVLLFPTLRPSQS